MHFSFTIVFHSNCNLLDGWTQILWFADTETPALFPSIPDHWPFNIPCKQHRLLNLSAPTF